MKWSMWVLVGRRVRFLEHEISPKDFGNYKTGNELVTLTVSLTKKGKSQDKNFTKSNTLAYIVHYKQLDWVPQLFSICCSTAAAIIPIASTFAATQYSSQMSAHLPAGGPMPNREDCEQY